MANTPLKTLRKVSDIRHWEQVEKTKIVSKLATFERQYHRPNKYLISKSSNSLIKKSQIEQRTQVKFTHLFLEKKESVHRTFLNYPLRPRRGFGVWKKKLAHLKIPPKFEIYANMWTKLQATFCFP